MIFVSAIRSRWTILKYVHINYKNNFLCYWDCIIQKTKSFFFNWISLEASWRIAQPFNTNCSEYYETSMESAIVMVAKLWKNVILTCRFFPPEDDGRILTAILTSKNTRNSQAVCWLILFNHFGAQLLQFVYWNIWGGQFLDKLKSSLLVSSFLSLKKKKIKCIKYVLNQIFITR